MKLVDAIQYLLRLLHSTRAHVTIHTGRTEFWRGHTLGHGPTMGSKMATTCICRMRKLLVLSSQVLIVTVNYNYFFICRANAFSTISIRLLRCYRHAVLPSSRWYVPERNPAKIRQYSVRVFNDNQLKKENVTAAETRRHFKHNNRLQQQHNGWLNAFYCPLRTTTFARSFKP